MANVFERKIYKKLLEFKAHNGDASLLIEGARRIGKSTITQIFGEKEYKSYIFLDFEKDGKLAKEPFDQLPDLTRFFQTLMSNYNKKLYPRDSLIVFDEVQLFPRARQAIKELVADGRYDYIETGSLISIQRNIKNILIPSEEETIRMYPLDFEEFLIIRNEEMLVENMKNAYEKNEPLVESIHQRLLREFNRYLFVGGMPKPNLYDLEGARFQEIERQKRLICDIYEKDAAKLDADEKVKTGAILKSLPYQLQSGFRNFQLSGIFDKNNITKENSIYDLENSMMVNVCRTLNQPSIDFNLYANPNKIKIYMNDTGLLNTMTFNDDDEKNEEEFFKSLSFAKLPTNRGYLYENVVAQLLVSSGKKLYKYIYSDPKQKRVYELDFVFRRGKKLVPVEVKSSSSNKHSSIDFITSKFQDVFTKPIILSNSNLHIEDDADYYPVYMASLLK